MSNIPETQNSRRRFTRIGSSLTDVEMRATANSPRPPGAVQIGGHRCTRICGGAVPATLRPAARARARRRAAACLRSHARASLRRLIRNSQWPWAQAADGVLLRRPGLPPSVFIGGETCRRTAPIAPHWATTKLLPLHVLVTLCLWVKPPLPFAAPPCSQPTAPAWTTKSPRRETTSRKRRNMSKEPQPCGGPVVAPCGALGAQPFRISSNGGIGGFGGSHPFRSK